MWQQWECGLPHRHLHSALVSAPGAWGWRTSDTESQFLSSCIELIRKSCCPTPKAHTARLLLHLFKASLAPPKRPPQNPRVTTQQPGELFKFFCVQ
jgi:hypothetical protein